MPDDLGPGSFEWQGVRYRTLLSAQATGGRLSVTDSWTPAGAGPPRHVHAQEDETFVILSGRHEFWMAGETTFREAGESVFIPRGLQHTFRVCDAAPGRHMVILTPGGFEGFFAEMSAGGFRIPEDMARIAEVAARFNLRFTGPPLGAPAALEGEGA